MIIEKVKEVLGEHLDMDTTSIDEETTFEDWGIESLETVEVMMELEDEFEMEIPVAEIGNTVGSLVAYIESNKE